MISWFLSTVEVIRITTLLRSKQIVCSKRICGSSVLFKVRADLKGEVALVRPPSPIFYCGFSGQQNWGRLFYWRPWVRRNGADATKTVRSIGET